MNKKVLFSIVLTGLSVQSLFAQTAEKEPYSDTYVYMILAALLFTLAVLFASLMIFESAERKKKVKVTGTVLTGNIMQEHEYDGIQELDNPAPAWFQALFYITIVFAIVYMVQFHLIGKSNSSADEYLQEMMIASQQRDALLKSGGLINESNVGILTDAADISKGKEIFAVNCVSCHNADGGGGVGPNLTDEYWIHGGGIKNVFATIKNGVPAKGMIAWQTQLNPKQMNQVASYVLTLQGTKPASPKAPEGNIWVDTTATTPKDTLKK
ncbi:MAG: cbb3-type cytochrome c oxidase N-terminal domain-containing protein [Ignavibacteria bacterium]